MDAVGTAAEHGRDPQVFHGSQAFHDATELLGPVGRVGQGLSYTLVAAPLLYMLWARRAKPPRGPAPG